jgi:hypothetical protein
LQRDHEDHVAPILTAYHEGVDGTPGTRQSLTAKGESGS